MISRPIILNGQMVRALPTKNQTRRTRGLDTINAEPDAYLAATTHGDGAWWFKRTEKRADGLVEALIRCPYGVPGDRLWVRETCRAEERADMVDGVRYLADKTWLPIANTKPAADAWVELNTYRGKRGATVPPIHMPRWASRHLLEISDIRVQRLRDITEVEAIDEGVLSLPDEWVDENFPSYRSQFAAWFSHGSIGAPPIGPSPRDRFLRLFQSINGTAPAAFNPYVWALTFRRITA